MTRKEMKEVMQRVFSECSELRECGQKEYAHDKRSAFANFERLSEGEFNGLVSREQVLWVYAMKHKDGIASWLNGHRSQREEVEGRINDLIVYLCLLRGMIEEGKAEGPAERYPGCEKEALPRDRIIATCAFCRKQVRPGVPFVTNTKGDHIHSHCNVEKGDS